MRRIRKRNLETEEWGIRSEGESIVRQWNGVHDQRIRLPDYREGHVSLVENDALHLHKLMAISLKMVYGPVLRSHMFLLIFIYLGSILALKACQSANKFSRIWATCMKQCLRMPSERLDLNHTWAHVHITPHGRTGPLPFPFQRTLRAYGSFSINRFLNSGLFSLNAFQL